VLRLALDALVWTGEGSPTLTERAAAAGISGEQSPADHRAFVHSIFTRDHPGTSISPSSTLRDAVLALDSSMPTAHTSHVGEPAGHRSDKIRGATCHARAMGTASRRTRTRSVLFPPADPIRSSS